MNDNARQLYDDLLNERLPEFDMTDVTTVCGTPSCIGGHAEARRIADIGVAQYGIHVNRQTFDWLGITPEVGDELCFPKFNGPEAPWAGHADPYQATQPEAAAALKRACELSEAK